MNKKIGYFFIDWMVIQFSYSWLVYRSRPFVWKCTLQYPSKKLQEYFNKRANHYTINWDSNPNLWINSPICVAVIFLNLAPSPGIEPGSHRLTGEPHTLCVRRNKIRDSIYNIDQYYLSPFSRLLFYVHLSETTTISSRILLFLVGNLVGMIRFELIHLKDEVYSLARLSNFAALPLRVLDLHQWSTAYEAVGITTSLTRIKTKPPLINT